MQGHAKPHGSSGVTLSVALWSLSPKVATSLQPIDGGEGHSTEVSKVTKGRFFSKGIHASTS